MVKTGVWFANVLKERSSYIITSSLDSSSATNRTLGQDMPRVTLKIVDTSFWIDSSC